MEHVPPPAFVPASEYYRMHERVRIVGGFPGEELGLATIEGGPLRTAIGVVKWLVRPIGLARVEWVPAWRLERL